MDLTGSTPKQQAKKQRTIFEVMNRMPATSTPEQRVAALQPRLAPEVLQQQQQRPPTSQHPTADLAAAFSGLFRLYADCAWAVHGQGASERELLVPCRETVAALQRFWDPVANFSIRETLEMCVRGCREH